MTDSSVKACLSNFQSLSINFCIIVLTLRDSPDLEALIIPVTDMGIYRCSHTGKHSCVAAAKINKIMFDSFTTGILILCQAVV